MKTILVKGLIMLGAMAVYPVVMLLLLSFSALVLSLVVAVILAAAVFGWFAIPVAIIREKVHF